MAVVQISRIQHRRGRKLTGTGMPQLSSGEIGWAIDTQELYIGNGAVSEGAPYVGNTKILTEHDNIFDLANYYSYKENNNLWGNTVPTSRTLQQKLDDVVSVFDFGATGDGTDQTVSLQKAINSLYKNTEILNRVILFFPPGEYVISSTLLLPPFATIRGAGKGKTLITANNCDAFSTIHYNPNIPLETINNNNQCRYAEITGMSIHVNSNSHSALDIRSCINSVFKDLKLTGVWQFGNTLNSHKGIVLYSETTAITCKNNLFDNIEIDSFNFGVYSDYDIIDNLFVNCNLYKMKYGFVFGFGIGGIGQPPIGSVGQLTGPLNNTVKNSVFDRIDKEGIYVKYGDFNTSQGNKYRNVGNDSAGTPIAVAPVISYFTNTNVTDNDFFERTEDYTPNKIGSLRLNQEYVPEVSGRTNYVYKYANEISIGNTLIPIELLKFPILDNGTIFIDYVYTETTNDIVREGVIELVINQSSNDVILNDNYSYIGNALYSASLIFSATLSDLGAIRPNEDTVILSVVNTTPVLSDNFYYTIRVKS